MAMGGCVSRRPLAVGRRRDRRARRSTVRNREPGRAHAVDRQAVLRAARTHADRPRVERMGATRSTRRALLGGCARRHGPQPGAVTRLRRRRIPTTRRSTRRNASPALIRAALSRDPDRDDWNDLFVPYRDGGTWLAGRRRGVRRRRDSSTTSSPARATRWTRTTGSARRGAPTGRSISATSPASARRVPRSTCKHALDQAAAAGGGTVELAPGEVDPRRRHRDRQPAAGRPERRHPDDRRPRRAVSSTRAWAASYPTGPTRRSASTTICSNVAMVRVEAGGALTNVWVEGDGLDADQFKIAAVESSGSTDAQPTKIVGNRVSAPTRDGVGIRARGLLVERRALHWRGHRRQPRDRLRLRSSSSMRSGQARWADGIAVGCESTQRQRQRPRRHHRRRRSWSTASYNRALATMRSQTSTVTANRVLSAGLSGSCRARLRRDRRVLGGSVGRRRALSRRGRDRATSTGATISGNTYWTGPRTHFDVGLMVGGGVRWGDHRIFGVGRVGIGQHDRAERRTREHRRRRARDGQRDALEQHRARRSSSTGIRSPGGAGARRWSSRSVPRELASTSDHAERSRRRRTTPPTAACSANPHRTASTA